ncbi:MAG: hypothetical protein ACK41F_07210 [Fimbriimonadaceae bacterium]
MPSAEDEMGCGGFPNRPALPSETEELERRTMEDRFTETEQERLERLQSVPYTWVADVTYRFFVTFAMGSGRARAEYRQQRTLYLMTNGVAGDLRRLFQMALTDASAEAIEAVASAQRAETPLRSERVAAIEAVSLPEFRLDAIYALEADAEDDFPPEYVYQAGPEAPWIPASLVGA